DSQVESRTRRGAVLRMSRGGFLVLVAIVLATSVARAAGDLPRRQVAGTAGKSGNISTERGEAPREVDPNVAVLYDNIRDAKGQKLRTIITRPKDRAGKLPVIFLAGWLSCDSVEAPNDAKDGSARAIRALAELPGFCTFRMDKPGCGDSEGVCGE